MRRPTAGNGKARANRALQLKRIRLDRGLTQVQLGERVGVSHAQIWRYEQARDDPSLDVLDRILVVLECWYIDLLADPEMPIPNRRPMRRPVDDIIARSMDVVIKEFAHPSRAAKHYPDVMRCWLCHGRPGECHCYSICKVCGLPFCRDRECSGVLHAA